MVFNQAGILSLFFLSADLRDQYPCWVDAGNSARRDLLFIFQHDFFLFQKTCWSLNRIKKKPPFGGRSFKNQLYFGLTEYAKIVNSISHRIIFRLFSLGVAGTAGLSHTARGKWFLPGFLFSERLLWSPCYRSFSESFHLYQKPMDMFLIRHFLITTSYVWNTFINNLNALSILKPSMVFPIWIRDWLLEDHLPFILFLVVQNESCK